MYWSYAVNYDTQRTPEVESGYPWALISTNCDAFEGRETKWIANTPSLSMWRSSLALH